MDKDKVKGTIDDSIGRAKRQVGEWTGDSGAQVEGAAQQVKGKTEKAWGNVKDAARDIKKKAEEHDEKRTVAHDDRIPSSEGRHSEERHPVGSHK